MSSAAGSLRKRLISAEVAGTPLPGPFLTHAAVYGWLGLAILLFLLQALPYLSCRWVPDESWYSAPAYSIIHGNGIANPAFGPNELENHIDARPPGTAIVVAAAFRLFGTGPITARLGSILGGLAVILLTYFLACDVIGQAGALVATFLVATDNLIVLASRTARPEALTTMAVLLSLLAMRQYARYGLIGWAFLSGLLIALGTMFHITLLGYIVSFGILAIVLDRRRGGFPLRGASAYSFGYALGLMPFAVWLLTTPLGRAGFRQEYLGKAEALPLWSKFLHEGQRYYDLLGFNMLHGQGLESIPVRLPIPLIFLAASFLLWKLCRRWFYLEVLLLVPTLFWFIYVFNKTSRYFALVAPIFALAIGAAVATTSSNRRLHRAVVFLSCLVVAAQMSANVFLLHSARRANYDKVAAELRSVIPPGQTAYGAVAFWIALHDRTYISYERTDPWMAANQFHARYFIANDRIMINGLPGDEVFYESLRKHIAEVAAQSRLAGQVSDPYYGDIKVYELNAP
jgi:4-amino-4-deoxy-L-arabinose transferase-like glycosyltransferase